MSARDSTAGSALPAPTPLAGKNRPVDWLFVFKFNGASFPGCTDDGTTPALGSGGIFGGTVEGYPAGHSQQYVFATSANPALAMGSGCVGATADDPLGATFGQVYETPGYFYVLWNDQFYGNPIASEGAPLGHSKGMLAWNGDGEGFVLQVSTPSWPAAGSSASPRQNDGNTLGCIKDDDIEVSQHFFALKLGKGDLAAVLQALANASVVTNVQQPSIVRNGGPSDIQALVSALGKESASTDCPVTKLSSGVQLISKPSRLNVPPWQLVSAKLNALPLRVASWWASPQIYSTAADSTLGCWKSSLGKAGPVEIATTGAWGGKTIGLEGGEGDGYNHAKIGLSQDPSRPLCIFGDMNQQGALGPHYAYPNQQCSSSQNGRGGTFYVLSNGDLLKSLTQLLRGASAPVKPAAGSPPSSGAAKPASPKSTKNTKAAPARGGRRTASMPSSKGARPARRR